MGIRDESTRPYKKTVIGRMEAVLAGAFSLMKRTGAGSIAIAIGALGAGALLATTLVFPPPPVQKVFQTPAGGNGNDVTFARPDEDEDAIQVPTDKSDDAVASPASPDDGPSVEVLAALESRGDEAGGATIVAETETGGIQLDKDGAIPGGQGPDTDEPDKPAEKPDSDDGDDGDDGDEGDSDDDARGRGGAKGDEVKQGGKKAGKYDNDDEGSKHAKKSAEIEKRGGGDEKDDKDDQGRQGAKIVKHSGDNDGDEKDGKISSSDDGDKKAKSSSSSDDDEGKKDDKKPGKHYD